MREYLKLLKENLNNSNLFKNKTKKLLSDAFKILEHIVNVSNKPKYVALKSSNIFTKCFSNLKKTLKKFMTLAKKFDTFTLGDKMLSHFYIEYSIGLIIDIPFSGKDGAFSLKPLEEL